MTTWFTSDLHFGHENIIKFCDRPFPNVTMMNQELVWRWNALVEPEDTVFVLGDLALGSPFNESLLMASMLVGKKFLVPGNHDRMWSGLKKPAKGKWYEDAGFTILDEQTVIFRDIDMPVEAGVHPVKGKDDYLLLCHFPYVGDSQEVDRHAGYRPKDEGLWLLHGHTHWPKTYDSAVHQRQIHVGVDAWDYEPVPMEWINDIIIATEPG